MPNVVRKSGRSNAAVVLVTAVTLVAVACIYWIIASGSSSRQMPPSTAGPELGKESVAPGSNLAIAVNRCDRTGDSLRVEGTLRNTGDVLVRYVDAEITWLDAMGETVETVVIHVVSEAVIDPGASVAFRSAIASPRASDCRVRLFSYEPI